MSEAPSSHLAETEAQVERLVQVFGLLVAWAEALGESEAAALLQESLDEEKAADQKLSGLAESGVNAAAATGDNADEDEDDADVDESPAGASHPAGRSASSKR